MYFQEFPATVVYSGMLKSVLAKGIHVILFISAWLLSVFHGIPCLESVQILLIRPRPVHFSMLYLFCYYL